MKIEINLKMLVIILALMIILGGCAAPNVSEQPVIKKAIVMLEPTDGNTATGTVTFIQTDKGILAVADVSGLTPGKHGFHIHEFGDVTDLDGKSAGGHFNPTNSKHGGPQSAERHVGDLGNLVADDTGKAHYEWTDSIISFHGENSIIGRAVIIHAGDDDLKSQPTGNAGARVAHGVIGIAKANI
ncbi:superoxide dismutase family protein [candidate division KSB1 bacterium]|nr:superoxide dismutase family protein [candidate division KSB1 bacterium]